MRNLVVILLLFLCSFQCQRDCLSGTLQYNWVGFTPQEIDTLVIRQFQPGQLGTTLIDSVFAGVNDFYFSNQTSDTLMFAGAIEFLDLQPGFDYELWVPGTGQTFQITDIRQDQETAAMGCNNKTQCLTRITSAKLNGAEVPVYNWNSIYIER